jgi:dipeptidyl aminopeptidase/acylaminoacyl peptidase
LGERFAQNRYNVLTFNHSGTLESGGLSSFANTQLDIAAAYRFLTESKDLGVDVDRVVLGGWSYGGGMALTYAANHADIAAVFSIAGTDHGEFLREYTQDPAYRRMADGFFDTLSQPDSPWRLAPGATPRELLDQDGSVDAYDLKKLAPGLIDKHLLLIGGWDDAQVKIDTHVLPLYRALGSAGADRVTMLAFQTDHSFENVHDELCESILSWMDGLGE